MKASLPQPVRLCSHSRSLSVDKGEVDPDAMIVALLDGMPQAVTSADIRRGMSHQLIAHILGDVAFPAPVHQGKPEAVEDDARVVADRLVHQACGKATRLLGLDGQAVYAQVAEELDRISPP